MASIGLNTNDGKINVVVEYRLGCTTGVVIERILIDDIDVLTSPFPHARSHLTRMVRRRLQDLINQ